MLAVLGWRDDVPQLLRAMDVFLLTSVFEGLPRVVLQAMAAGVPVAELRPIPPRRDTRSAATAS